MRYQIIVLELQDPVVTPERLTGEGRHAEEVRGQRLGALQAALLHAMEQYNLQTCITFHHRTMEAQAYAEGLEAVAAKLYANRPERYPEQIWADWLCGKHVPEHRRDVLDAFGTTVRRAVLSNCRVLGEGVDITSVDSVAFLDPKGAPHDIVQAVGRALRQKPGEGKLASLIVPVFLQPGEQPEDMFTSGSYRPLVKVLEGLRAHDEEAVELLAIPQEPQKDVAQPSVTIGTAPGEGEEESRLLLRFAAPRDPVTVANWVSFNVIDTERQDWARGWAKLKTFTEREGHARVPYAHREGATPLGQWVAEQRRAYSAGQLSGRRARRLEQLGMIWSVTDERFQKTSKPPAPTTRNTGLCALPGQRRPWTARSGSGCPTCVGPVHWTGAPSGGLRWKRWMRTGIRRGLPGGSGTTPPCANSCVTKTARPVSCPASPSTEWMSVDGSSGSANMTSGRGCSRDSVNAWSSSASCPCPRGRRGKRRRWPPTALLGGSSGA